MVDNSTIRGDEKNQNNQKEFSGIGAPRLGDTITLRDAARALAGVAPGKKGEKISDGKLLRGLKTSEVRAGFHCSADPLIWISIPYTYWVDITSDVFRSIRFLLGKKNRTGTYKVTLKDFPEEYISARIRVATDAGEEVSSDWVVKTFSIAVTHIESEFEVEIPKENWDQYLSKQVALTSPSGVKIIPDVKSGSGRNAFSGWKRLNAMLAAYLVANNIQSGEETQINTVAATVYALTAQEAEKTPLPDLQTFEKEVSRVFELIRRLRNA